MKLSKVQLTPRETGFLYIQTLSYNDLEKHNDTYYKIVGYYEHNENEEFTNTDFWRFTNYVSKPMIEDRFAQSCKDSCLNKLKAALKNEEAHISQNQFGIVECNFSDISNLLGSVCVPENGKNALVFLLEADLCFHDAQSEQKEMLLQINRKMFSEIFDSISESQLVDDATEIDVNFFATITFYGEVIQSTSSHLPIYISHDYILG